MKLSSLLFFLIVFVSATASAAPVINSVSGSYAEGATITIQGSAFGSGPNLVLFDNFEGGAAGAAIRTGVNSATVGQWNRTIGNVYYTDSTKVSGGKAFQADMTSNLPPEAAYNAYSAVDFSPDSEAFMSWWFYLPAGDKWPGENHAEGINWKIVWIYGHCDYTEDMVLPVVLGAGANITGDPVGCDWCPGPPWPDDPANPIDDAYLGLDLEKGRWLRVWTWIKGGYSNDAAMQYWELTNAGVSARLNRSNFNNLYPPGIPMTGSRCGSSSITTAKYQTVLMNAYGRSTPPSHPTFDDFYLATGANARARVEIGNQPVYNSSTKLAILTASSWTSASITASMRQGIFRPGDTAYVFVVDASGNISSGSQAITIGAASSGDSVAPNAPSGLQVSE